MNLPPTYSGFLKNIQHYEIGDTQELISSLTGIGSKLNLFFEKFMPACYILDYTSGKYIHATPRVGNFIDASASAFIDGGLELTTSLFHPKDLKIYSEKILSENLMLLKNTPIEKHADLLFRCNYRIRIKKGGYRNVNQESIFIKSADNKMPLAAIGFLYDLTACQRGSKMIHEVIDMSAENLQGVDRSIISNVFFENEQDAMLTKREIEILRYVCDDLSSEEIAEKLFISKHTVNNHRRNLLQKTNIKTSQGLVKFAIERGFV